MNLFAAPDGSEWCQCGHGKHDGVCGATKRLTLGFFTADKAPRFKEHDPCDCDGHKPLVYTPCGAMWWPGMDCRPRLPVEY